MTDWKQMTARSRGARTSKDPAGQLSNLYQKTRDAMVAFELAKFFETAGQNAMPRNGTPRLRRDFAARIGKLKRRKRRCVLAARRGRFRWKRGPHRRKSLL